MNIDRQYLIDLAVEYSLIRSTWQFNEMTEKMQEAVLKQMRKVVGR